MFILRHRQTIYITLIYIRPFAATLDSLYCYQPLPAKSWVCIIHRPGTLEIDKDMKNLVGMGVCVLVYVL